MINIFHPPFQNDQKRLYRHFQESLPHSSSKDDPMFPIVRMVLGHKIEGGMLESYINFITGPSFPWHDTLCFGTYFIIQRCKGDFGQVTPTIQQKVAFIKYKNV